jgi:hypothetical protein
MVKSMRNKPFCFEAKERNSVRPILKKITFILVLAAAIMSFFPRQAAPALAEESNRIHGFLIEENAASLAAKLTELSNNPARTKEVGEAAGREIYISWEDAVANAYDRYEVVIDRYRSGFYKTRLPYDYDFFRAQGELMETLGNIDAARHSIIKDAEELRGDMDRKARSIRNKALTDIITAGYETRQGINAIRKDMHDELSSIGSDIKTQIRETADEFWEVLDRYL